VLSLDAPLVVVLWQWLFAAEAGVNLRWPEVFVVGASVWLAYAADRWLETWLVPREAIQTPRHRFYADRRWPLAMIWLLVLLADVVTAFTRLSHRELLGGFLLLLPVLAYVTSHQFLHRNSRWRLPKELCIAALIAGGALVFVVAEAPVRPMLLVPGAMFAMLCFANVSLIGVWESEVDRTQGQVSLAQQFKRAPALARSLPLLLAAVAAVASSPVFGVSPVAAHCTLASSMLLALIDRFEARIGWQLARVLVDVALFTPAIPLLHGLRA